MTGTPSRTATAFDGGTTRHSVAMVCPVGHRNAARVCGKEAEGKAPVRGTRIAYEACARWARARRDPKPDVTRNRRAYMRRMYGAKVTRLTPGGLSVCSDGRTRIRRWASLRSCPGRSVRARNGAERTACNAGIRPRAREAARSTMGRQESAESSSCQRTAAREEHMEPNRHGAFDAG